MSAHYAGPASVAMGALRPHGGHAANAMTKPYKLAVVGLTVFLNAVRIDFGQQIIVIN